MLLSSLIRSNLKSPLLRAFARDERAVTVVELALLAVPFFALIGAILETAVVFLASQILTGAVQDSSRLIRTGEAQSNSPAPYTAADYQNAICSRLFGLFDCTKLQVSVSVVSNFTTATVPPSPLDPTDPTKWTLTPTYNPGTGSSIVMVQVYYKWPVLFTFDGLSLATGSDNTHMLSAVRVFMNEPFTS